MQLNRAPSSSSKSHSPRSGQKLEHAESQCSHRRRHERPYPPSAPPTGPNTKQYPNYAFTSAPNRSGPWSILGRKGGNQKSYWKPGSTGTEKAGTERRQGWWVGPAPKGDPGGRLGTPPPRQVCGTAWGMCVECRPCCRIRAWPRGGMPVWFGPIHR